MICFPGATAMLVVPTLRLDLFGIKCKFKDIKILERKKSMMLLLQNNDMIIVYEQGKMIDRWAKSDNICDSCEVFCQVQKTISILALKILVSILQDYSNDLPVIETYIDELLENFDDSDLTQLYDQLHDGIWERAFVFQKLLQRMITKKRWKLALTFGRLCRNYQLFLEEYYSPEDKNKPGGKGYVLAKDNFKCKFEVLVSFPFSWIFQSKDLYAL